MQHELCLLFELCHQLQQHQQHAPAVTDKQLRVARRQVAQTQRGLAAYRAAPAGTPGAQCPPAAAAPPAPRGLQAGPAAAWCCPCAAPPAAPILLAPGATFWPRASEMLVLHSRCMRQPQTNNKQQHLDDLMNLEGMWQVARHL